MICNNLCPFSCTDSTHLPPLQQHFSPNRAKNKGPLQNKCNGPHFIYKKSIKLCAGGDVVIHHQQMQLLLAFLGVDGRKEHTARFDAHHGSGRQIGDGNESLADQLFRLIVSMDAAEDGTLATVWKGLNNNYQKW